MQFFWHLNEFTTSYPIQFEWATYSIRIFAHNNQKLLLSSYYLSSYIESLTNTAGFWQLWTETNYKNKVCGFA